MIDARKMIEQHGLDGARRLVTDKADRQRLEIAAAMLADDGSGFSVCHAGFALTALPHKDVGAEVWRREGHNVTLIVAPGHDRQGKPIALPYGSKARHILLFLQTRAVQTGCREVELGASLKAWMTAMGIVSTGGATYKTIRDQATRLSACRLTFYTDRPGAVIKTNAAFVENEISLVGCLNDDQPSLWQDSVRLNADFYQSLLDHPVPVAEAALRALGPKSMAIDIYVWLAYRLHALAKPTAVSWAAAYAQFGAGFGLMKHFKAPFLDNLTTALAAYPDAKVEVTDAGIMLHPSRPPIAKAIHRLGRN